ncbi:flagellar motor protein MotB [Oceanobacillus salinisoli]|uniref:flagellar motor protein MotB n=1 Tax=Oceanobacillus salinisoli TaxID=2678611 RepID=UPI0012E0D9E8|nr:flagellar motor protein MotB [Oceanobacillus salinisoli]
MRKKKKKGHHVDESWLLPYSDLLTLLVALFIVLFAMSDINVQKYEELASFFRDEFAADGEGILEQNKGPGEVRPPSDVEEDSKEEHEEEKEEEYVDEALLERRELESMQASINAYIAENNLEDDLGTTLTDEGLLVTILNDVFFDSGSAAVKSDGRLVAREISNFLYSDPPHQIVISGHADDVPVNNRRFASNWELSVTRAVNFMTLVLENGNLDPTLFSAKGYGEYNPIVPNTSEENRAKNRRVEVLILPNYEINMEE